MSWNNEEFIAECLYEIRDDDENCRIIWKSQTQRSKRSPDWLLVRQEIRGHVATIGKYILHKINKENK